MIESKCDKLAKWLKQYLASQGGDAFVRDIYAAAREAGFNPSLLPHVKTTMLRSVVIHKRIGYGKEGRWYWRLNRGGIQKMLP
jgi:hypothetical protein